MTARSCALVGGAVLLLLELVATDAAAQTWRVEQARLNAEMAQLFTTARDAGATDISGIAPELESLHAEYLDKVVRPAMREAVSCGQRMGAIELLIGLERQAQLLGSSVIGGELISQAYSDAMFERCMNELYRACVVEDNPMYAVTMTAWVIGHERQKQLLGGGGGEAIEIGTELDPRITACRGPWYEVRVVVERSGTDAETGPWRDRDVSEGWLGRGLTGRVPPSAPAHPGGFTRRVEQMSYGARCPDGGCPGICGFTAVAEGRAIAEYDMDPDAGSRILTIRFAEDEGEERLERNECPHEDLPISLGSGQLEALFPADLVSPLTDGTELPGGADPRMTESLDEWPRMFPSSVAPFDDPWEEPLGRLEVVGVCDGQEIWGNGSAKCRQKWQEVQELYRQLTGGLMLVAPWERSPGTGGAAS